MHIFVWLLKFRSWLHDNSHAKSNLKYLFADFEMLLKLELSQACSIYSISHCNVTRMKWGAIWKWVNILRTGEHIENNNNPKTPTPRPHPTTQKKKKTGPLRPGCLSSLVVRILSLTLRVLCLFLCRLMARALTVGHRPWKGQCVLLNVLGFHNNMNMHGFTSLLLYYISMFTNSLGEFFPFSLVQVNCWPIHKLMGELHHHLSIILDGWPMATTVSSTLLHNCLWEKLNFKEKRTCTCRYGSLRSKIIDDAKYAHHVYYLSSKQM